MWASLLLILVTLTTASPVVGERQAIRFAVATSVEKSALLEILLPPFGKRTGYQVQVIPAGTGRALHMGRAGDVDVILVHAYTAEQQFVGNGYGVNRRDVMYNDFIIVGPQSDPAGIKGERNAAQAMTSIAFARTTFISRGDDSGTHRKERALWKAAALRPNGKWYLEAGQGQGKTLQMAGELGAYALTDRGTWLVQKNAHSVLVVLVEGDPRLYNRYGIMAVSPAKHPDVNYIGAMALIAWFTDPRAQSLIRDYQIAGQPLFLPLALER